MYAVKAGCLEMVTYLAGLQGLRMDQVTKVCHSNHLCLAITALTDP